MKNLTDTEHNILKGDFSLLPKTKSNILKIFLSSTFSGNNQKSLKINFDSEQNKLYLRLR
jgi:hypothetical protein